MKKIKHHNYKSKAIVNFIYSSPHPINNRIIPSLSYHMVGNLVQANESTFKMPNV